MMFNKAFFTVVALWVGGLAAQAQEAPVAAPVPDFSQLKRVPVSQRPFLFADQEDIAEARRLSD